MLATDSGAVLVAVRGCAVDAGVAASLTTTVDCRFVDVERADPERFVGSLPAEFGVVSVASGVAAAAVATGVSGVAASAEGASAAGCSAGNAAFGCCVGNVAAGCSAGAAVVSAVGTPVWLGLAPADAMVSLLDDVARVCAPLELCTIPERGSEEEPAADADEFVAEVGLVDDGLAADFDDESEADDEESGDGVEEPVSVGSANATPGVFATAAPRPSATANAPTRTLYCAFTGLPLFRSARPYERQPVSSFQDG